MKSKSTVKAAVAAAMLALAGTAAADINTGNQTTPSTVNGVSQVGNGELFLSVWNTTTQTSYTRDLGINLSSFLPTGSAGVNNVTAGNGVDYAFGVAPTSFASNVLTPGYKLIFGKDNSTALTSLLGAAGTIWSVVANDNVGGRRLMFTSNNAAPVVNDTQLATATANISGHLSAVNALQAGTTANPNSNSSSTASGLATPAYSGNSAFSNNFGTFAFNTSALVGTAENFWLAATGAGASQYTGATWLLSNDGTLKYEVAAAPIPEADTWAMMLAGLTMFGVMMRRRRRTV